ENGRFDEADYYRRALAALHEPLVRRKIAAHDFASNPLLKPPPRLASVADLRRLLERVLVWRGPLAFWLDNAHALASGWVEQRLEWLRSLADATNTPHVLAGTYDLLHLWNLNGQLGRRSHDIHFGRYHLDQPVDQQDFLRVLVSFEQQLPEGTNLLESVGIAVRALDRLRRHRQGLAHARVPLGAQDRLRKRDHRAPRAHRA